MKITRTPSPALKNLEAALGELGSLQAKVGWLNSGHYLNGMPVAAVAQIQEEGTKKAGRNKNVTIPARPFMLPTVRAKSAIWKMIIASESRKVLKGAQSAHGVMDIIGLKAGGDFREAITKITTPELKESTVEARLGRLADGKTEGFLRKPLVDSGYMLNSLTHIVEKKGS